LQYLIEPRSGVEQKRLKSFGSRHVTNMNKLYNSIGTVLRFFVTSSVGGFSVGVLCIV
jgi:hypothetical protein